MRHLVLLPLLAACTGGTSETPAACEAPVDLDDGAVTALVDGAAWESGATWVAQGESVQLTAAPADGWNITLVARTAEDGATVKSAIDGGAFPITVPLSEGGGGFATVYPTDGSSYSSDGGGGTLVITGLAGDVLEACFDFDAATDRGKEVAVSEGGLRAVPFTR